MICKMDKRAFGIVALLGFAFALSRPALAQEEGDTWFDGSEAETPPPAPSSPPTEAPSAAPGPQVPYGATPTPESAPESESPPPSPGPDQDNTPETDPQALTEFRPTLDPYGSWVSDPKYGTVWVPNREAVGNDFAPYVSAGHWALTEDGDWAWQSDYPFGGVVFHYGRWVWVPGTGWAWVAGRRYANAWVNWRVADDGYDYIGWAPMPPAWGWYGGSAISLGWYAPTAYVFCPSRYAFSYGVHSYIVHDRYLVHDVAAHSHQYWGGRVQHSAAVPRVLPANSAPPRGPTLQSARIPASFAPAARIPTRSAFVSGRAGMSAPYGADGARRSFGSVPRPIGNAAYGSSGARFSAPAYRSPAPYNATPTYRSSPSFNSPVYRSPAPYNSTRTYRSSPSFNSTPTYRSSPSFNSTPTYRSSPSFNSTPAYRSSPSFNSAPTYRAAPSFHSAPAYRSSPSFNSAPTYRAAPSFHSAPAIHSAPSFHSSRR